MLTKFPLIFIFGSILLIYIIIKHRSDLKKKISSILNFPNFTPTMSPWKDNPKWVLFCRLVLWVSTFSLIGLLFIPVPTIIYRNLPPNLRFPFIILHGILFLLSIISGTAVYTYERKRMRH